MVKEPLALSSTWALRALPWLACGVLLVLFLRTLGQQRATASSPVPSAGGDVLVNQNAVSPETSEGPSAPPAAAAGDAVVSQASPQVPPEPASPRAGAHAPRAQPADVLPRPVDPGGAYASAEREATLHAALEIHRTRARALEAALAAAQSAAQASADAPQVAAPTRADNGTDPAPAQAPSPELGLAHWQAALSDLRGEDMPRAARQARLAKALSKGTRGLREALAGFEPGSAGDVRPGIVTTLLMAPATPAAAQALCAVCLDLAPADVPGTIPHASWTLAPFLEEDSLLHTVQRHGATSELVLARIVARPLPEGADTGALAAAIRAGLGGADLAYVALTARIAAHHAHRFQAGSPEEGGAHKPMAESLLETWQRLGTDEEAAEARVHVLHALARGLAARSEVPEALRDRLRAAALLGLRSAYSRERVAATLLVDALLVVDAPGAEGLGFDPHGSEATRSRAILTLQRSWDKR